MAAHEDRRRVTTRLTILPLRGGEAVWFDAPGARDDLLIDCGNESSFEFITKPFLRSQGVNELPALFLTHGDARNVGGAGLLREQFSIRRIGFNPAAFRSPAYRQFREQCERLPGLAQTLPRGATRGPWTVLHPDPADHFPQADDSALVLRADLGGARVLLLSDLGKPGQNTLLARHADLRADIVVAGLPEQSEPLADALLDALQPRLVLITDAEFPATQRAGAKLRARLARRNIRVLYARDTGAITLEWRGPSWRERTAYEDPGR